MPRLVPDAVPAGRMSALVQPGLAVDELVLRPFDASDAPALVAVYADPAVQRWHGRSMSEPEAQDWILGAHAGWAAETSANWAVTQDDDSVVGRVGFRVVELAEGVAEIAYWTAPAARGRNIAPRVVAAVSAWMFTEIGLHRLELNHATANVASCRVAGKTGYVLEGTRRQSLLHVDGWHDMHVHARLASDRDGDGNSDG